MKSLRTKITITIESYLGEDVGGAEGVPADQKPSYSDSYTLTRGNGIGEGESAPDLARAQINALLSSNAPVIAEQYSFQVKQNSK